MEIIDVKIDMRVKWQAWNGRTIEGNIIKPCEHRPESVLLRLDNGNTSVSGINELTPVLEESEGEDTN